MRALNVYLKKQIWTFGSLTSLEKHKEIYQCKLKLLMLL
jgi:hypothetical protein